MAALGALLVLGVVVRVRGVEDLVFEAGVLVPAVAVEVLDAAVGGLGELEVELEDEVLVLLLGGDVAAAAELRLLGRKLLPLAVLVDPASRQDGEDAVLDCPPMVGGGLAAALLADPAVEGLAVPEERPAVLHLVL